MLSIGDKAVYPAHGVGIVKRIESRMIGGLKTDFLVLEIISSGARLMVPRASAERAGVRPLASEKDLERAFSTLRETPQMSHSTWNRRFREFHDKLRGGVLAETAEVLRDLTGLRADKDLSYGERKILDKALCLLATEVSLVRNIPLDEAETFIISALKGALPCT